RARSRPGSVVDGRAEAAVALIEEDGGRAPTAVGRGDVGLAVTAQVPDGKGPGIATRGILVYGSEGAVAGVEEDRDRVRVSPRGIELAIAVEILEGDVARLTSQRVVDRRLEGSMPVVDQKRHRLRDEVPGEDVEFGVAVHVAHRDREGALRVAGLPDLVLVRGPEPAVSAAVEDRDEAQPLERRRIVVEPAVRSDAAHLAVHVHA